MQLFLVKMTCIDKAHIIGGWARRSRTKMQVLELESGEEGALNSVNIHVATLSSLHF